MRIALAGDVMLGRNVARAIEANPPEHVWGNILPLLHEADLRIVNLECAIARPGAHPRWTPPKAFYFLAGPKAVDVLKAARIDLVTLANNHALDHTESALVETLERLDAAGIAHAGAGRTSAEARAPAVLESGGVRLAAVSFTDNEPDWEAGEDRPGVHYAPIDRGDPRFGRLERLLREAGSKADLVLAAAHWGPNMLDRPPPRHPPFARALLDAGAHAFVGHSAHLFQGIELHRGKPILYDLGDFVDDYAVDPELRNDRSFLWILEAQAGGVRRIEMVPVLIDSLACRVDLARGAEAEPILEKMVRLCGEMGTEARREGDRLVVSPGA